MTPTLTPAQHKVLNALAQTTNYRGYAAYVSGCAVYLALPGEKHVSTRINTIIRLHELGLVELVKAERHAYTTRSGQVRYATESLWTISAAGRALAEQS